MMDEPDLYAAPRRRTRTRAIGGPLILLLLAFVAGVALAAYAVHRWDRVARLVRPQIMAPAAPPSVPAAGVALVPALGAAPAIVAADPALGQRVDSLGRRMDAVETQARAASGDADRAEALLVAFATRRAIDAGEPLGYLEDLLHKHFGATDAAAVTMVIGAAQRPVTLLQLQDRLTTLAPTLAAPRPDEGWWTGLRRELGALLVVRSVQTPSAEPRERQSRADRAVAQGQVAAALDEIARMPGASRADGWIADARRYVLAHNALDRIEAAALLKPAPPVEGSATPDGPR